MAKQDDLRGKMEQLSSMYEEVSKRLEHLEVAFNDAEDQVSRSICSPFVDQDMHTLSSVDRICVRTLLDIYVGIHFL